MGSQSRIISLDDTSRSARYHRVASSSHNFKNSARQGRRSYAYYDDDDDTRDNEREEENTSSLAARITRVRRSHTKKKADRRYERQYGSFESTERFSSADAGPRAAVYETKMGSSHRKAARMQGSRSQGFSSRAATRRSATYGNYGHQTGGTGGGGRLNALASLFFGNPGNSSGRATAKASRKAADEASPKTSSKVLSRFSRNASSKKSSKTSSKTPSRGSATAHHLSARVLVPCVTAALIVLGCAFMYAPTRQYYQEVRERDRLEAEYEAVQARNVEIQNQIDALSTDEGVEDRAREEFGWVLQGENAGMVSGVDVEDDEDVSLAGNVSSDSIKAPKTWYSIILDPIFGVK